LQCPNCGHENPEGRRYCEECGERLIDIESLKARARRHSRREAARYRLDAEKKGLGAEEAERRRRRSQRRTSPWIGVLLLVVLVALIVVIILIATSGKSAPEKAVEDFYQALKNKDILTYLKYTEPSLYKMAVRKEYEPDPYAFFDYDYYEVRGLKTELVKEEGDVAEVKLAGGTFKGYNEGGNEGNEVDFSQHPRNITLTRIEDTWTVQDYAMMKLPYPLPEIVPGGSEFPEVEEPS
jgi:hypothetical protein